MGKYQKKIKATEASTTTGKVQHMVPKNLGEFRSKFDAIRAVANKLEGGAYKTQLMNGIEELYLDASTWFKGLSASPIEA